VESDEPRLLGNAGILSLFDLTGQVAIVTGGHSGLGRVMAETLAELGSAVAVAARREDACIEAAEALVAQHGVQAIGVRADVAEEADVDALVATVSRSLGTPTIVVNAAATFWAGRPEDVPLDKGWKRVLDVNVTGAFQLCRAVAARLLDEQRTGSIINVASSGGLMSFMPEAGSTISYTTSKGALIKLTQDLAAAWAANGIRVNALAPGSMAAGMMDTVPEDRLRLMVSTIPMGRRGRADELRGATAFLASEASSYVTGATLVVDGGQTIV